MHRLPRLLGAAAIVGLGVACGSTSDVPDNGQLQSAVAASRPTQLTIDGRVVDLLADAPKGADGPHQRFHVVAGGITVEIDHNLALAPRVPVTVGSEVVVHGQFEPDPGRPVIHYTHHATGRHQGGWIEVNGRRYQ